MNHHRASERKNSSFPSFIQSPSPRDFDAFLPWACIAWETPQKVLVTRVIQEDYKSDAYRRSSSAKSLKSMKSTKSFKSVRVKLECDVEPKICTKTDPATCTSTEQEPLIPVNAHYDSRGYLVEISITGCPINIHIKVIQALIVCVEYHSLLTKLTIRNGGLTSTTIYEIAKLMPLSNLTEICMDDSYVPEENYYVLLDHISHIKSLSLKRCLLSDLVCENIAERLGYEGSGYSLMTLELGSNLITDVGARALGDMLRRNRRLLHLGLSGNSITDKGAFSIFKHLTEFLLTSEEILETKRKRMNFIGNKMAIADKCFKELCRSEGKSFCIKPNIKTKLSKKNKKAPTTLVAADHSNLRALAEKMADEIIGDFQDPFGPDCVVERDDSSYSLGNMFLCSLNLAYNNLGYLSVKRVNEVIRYQVLVTKPKGASGLLRIILDGNCIPESCLEYSGIETLLKDAVMQFAPQVGDTGGASVSQKKNRKPLLNRVASYYKDV